MSLEFLYGHMLQEYYVQRVREIMARRAAERAKIRTPRQVMALRDAVRRKLRASFGPFPARTPLNAEVTGVVERPEYRIEKVIFQSRPGFPVTANLYVPRRGRAPFPAVLGTCGHSQAGKAENAYQAFAQHYARMGYLTLIYDPVSQGERYQYLKREGHCQPEGCCQEHNMAGNQMSLIGDYFGAWRAWDGIRALDYLLSRPEVDRARVGVTGNSGGGTLTSFLSALDDRFTMAAPSCYVTSWLSNIENELAADSEQIPPAVLAQGLDMADFFVAQIPRPTLLLGQRNDFFDCRGLDATYEELRRLYAILGREKDVELFIGPTNHGYSVHNREAAYRFFNRIAGVSSRATEPKNAAPEKPETLWATAKGQVQKHGARRIFDITRDMAQEIAEKRKPLSAPALKSAITRRLQLPERQGAPHYRILRPRAVEGKKPLRQSRFGVETEPGIQAILSAHMPPGEFGLVQHFPLAEKAILYVAHISAHQEVIHRQVPAERPFFTLDVRGIGETIGRMYFEDNFFDSYGSEYFFHSNGLMLNESYAGRRVHDLLRVLDLLDVEGYTEVHLVGRGLGAITSAFAACLHPLVKRVTLHNALLSYREITEAPVYSWPVACFPFGVLREFDLPDCYRLLKDKGLTLVSPWDSQMRPWARAALKPHLRTLGLDQIKVQWE